VTDAAGIVHEQVWAGARKIKIEDDAEAKKRPAARTDSPPARRGTFFRVA
jgi:hypothetical protein